MPITDIIIVCIIAAAFLIFAAGLAWGDQQTREIARQSRQRALSGTHVASLERSAEAESVERKDSEATRKPAHV
jgi:hypothetical protein